MSHNLKIARPAGIILILLGLVLLLSRSIGFDILVGRSFWPLYIIVPGLVLLASTSFDKALGKVLAPVGMVIATTGVLLAYQAWADHYQSWAYAWILTGPFSVGAGFIVHGIVHADHRSIVDGRKIATQSIAFFLAAAAIFELVFNISGYGLSFDLPWGIVLPIALILVGAVVVLHQPKHNVSKPDQRTDIKTN